VFRGVFSLKKPGAGEIENRVTALQVKSISGEMMAGAYTPTHRYTATTAARSPRPAP